MARLLWSDPWERERGAPRNARSNSYSEHKLDFAVGDWLCGQVYLGVDPFMYFENWEKRSAVPKIRCEWRVDRIYLETTPRVEVREKYLERDVTRFSEIEVEQTDAWHDDNGHAEYALECTEVGDFRPVRR